MKLLPKDPVKHLVVMAYIIVAFLFVSFVLPYAIRYILPFFVAFIISLIIGPVVNFLNKKLRINRKISTLVSIFFVIGILGCAVYGIGYYIVSFLQDFAKKIPEMLSGKIQFPAWVESIRAYIVKFPYPVRNFIYNIDDIISSNISTIIKPATSATIAFAGSTASKIPYAFLFTVVTILATYFISYDGDNIAFYIRKHAGDNKVDNMLIIKKRLFQACGAYFKAQLIMMSIMSVILMIGFFVLGIDNFAVIAIITAIVDAIPIFGTGTVLLPWCVVSLILGNFSRALGLLIMYIIALFTRQFIEPKIVSTQIGLHPLVTLMSMYLGFITIGIFGMIVGPIVAIVIIKAVEISKDSRKETVDDGKSQSTCS